MIVPSIASTRFACPATWLRQVGEFASSKSAMKPRAPEFSALMTSLRSVGPGDLDAPVGVVGPRRRDPPVGLADVARLGQEVERPAAPQRVAALAAGGEQLAAPRAEAVVQLGDEGDRVGGEDLRARALVEARVLDRGLAHDGAPSGARA